MNWRDIVVGASVTLIVTVLAGLAVWFLTREPAQTEHLTYSIQEIASLKTEPTTINIVVAHVANVGSKAAHRVKALIQFSSGAEIAETQVSSSSGLSASIGKSISPDKRRIEVDTSSLAPTEVISVSVLTRGVSDPRPSIAVRSDDSIGVEGITSTLPSSTSRSLSPLAAFWTTTGALLLQIVGLLIVWTQRKKISSNLSHFIGFPNDVAFVLAHRQLPSQAEAILRAKLFRRGGGPLELANYALCRGLLGKPDFEKYFAAAEGWSKSRHLRSVILFNRAAIAVSLNDLNRAETLLSEAIAIGRRTIIEYCAMSEYIQNAVKANPKIAELVEGKNKSKQATIDRYAH